MTLSEGLLRRGFLPEALKKHKTDIPLKERPEFKSKGYLYLSVFRNPNDPDFASLTSTLPEGFTVKPLGINSKDQNQTDLIIWNPQVADVQVTAFSERSSTASIQARTREDYLSSRGYKDFKLIEYPDRLVQVAIRRPVRTSISLFDKNYQAASERSTISDFRAKVVTTLEMAKRAAKKYGCLD